MTESLDSAARVCFDFFNSWVKAGFTEDQAARMVVLMMVEMQKLNPQTGGIPNG